MKVRALLIVVLLLGMLSPAALASESQEEHITQTAAAGLVALQSEDIEALVSAEFELHDTIEDPATSDACRIYADAALGALVMLEQVDYFPSSASLSILLGYVLEVLPQAKNDCLLAL